MTKIKNFWAENWKWLIGTLAIGIFIAGADFGVMQKQINDKPTKIQTEKLIENKINKTIIPRIKKNEDNISKQKQKENLDLSLLREIKFNLKALLNQQNIKYIELK